MHKGKIIDSAAQVLLPVLTLGSQAATSLKFPDYGLVLNLLAQPFWLYSTWKSWKSANQIGMFINTVIFTIITFFGIVNYWFLK